MTRDQPPFMATHELIEKFQQAGQGQVFAFYDRLDAAGQAQLLAEAEEIGNLVADDEYLGLGMELAEVVRLTLKEGLKENLREFLGKDDYKVRERTRVEH